MADGGDPPESDDLHEDQAIKKVVHDPGNIPSVIVLVGLLGRDSPEEEADNVNWRLYLTPALTDYITFERTALLHSEPSPSGGTMVWLDRDATVRYTHAESRQIQAFFLQGKMMNGAQASIPSFSNGPDGSAGANFWTYVGCPPSVFHC